LYKKAEPDVQRAGLIDGLWKAGIRSEQRALPWYPPYVVYLVML